MKFDAVRKGRGALYTDMYQLTMAQLYFRQGLHEREAQFDHFFRSYPNYGEHQAGYCINAGLAWFIDWMSEATFGESEIDYLRTLTGPSGAHIFQEDFLAWLQDDVTFESLTIDAIPEGRVVHPNVPLTVVRGPLAVAQIMETALLNQLNYQILIATKAARMREIVGDRILLEFGLRRAHGASGNEGARAALIGGANFTSNVGASRVLGLAPKGTHAHSMIQAFIALGGSELDAFRAYAELYPDNCLLLVDTIDTLNSGVPNAIKVFEELRKAGHQPVGIRLDSGDLAYLSVQAARMLNDAGFEDVSIVLSNQLDELTIWQILTQIREEAPRSGVDPAHLIARLTYGVGTRLITSRGASALGGVYKLVAIRQDGGWQPAIKLSERPVKIPNPGHKRAWRIYERGGTATADLLSLDDEDPRTMQTIRLRHPSEVSSKRKLAQDEIDHIEPLLVTMWDGQRTDHVITDIEAIRERRQADTDRLDPGVRRLIRPHIYHVSLTRNLWAYKQDLIAAVANGEQNGR